MKTLTDSLTIAKMSLSKDKQWLVLDFPAEEAADTCLSKIKSLISRSSSRDCQSTVTQYLATTETSYRFRLNKDQWNALRSQIRQQEKSYVITNDFLVKSLRADQQNYLRRFVEMIMPPFPKYPLREGPKKKFLATGLGYFSRNEKRAGSIPIKKSRYTSTEKQKHSKKQSTTLGTPDFHPPIFGLGIETRKDKLVGVMFDVKDALFSDHLYIYDGDTVSRPYDFYTASKAKDYYSSNANQILFHADQMNEFKAAFKAPENKGQHNEALARISWNVDGSSKVFIAADTLESRILAIDYSRVIKDHLIRNGLYPPNAIIPILFYLPGSSLHLKEYGALEQQMDFLQAKMIYQQQTLREQKYVTNDYEFLLLLPPEAVKEVLLSTFKGKPFALHILAEGYVHIMQSLLEKTGLALDAIVVGEKFFHPSNQQAIIQAIYNCLMTNNLLLAAYLLENYEVGNLQLAVKEGKTLLHVVAEKGLTEFVNLIALQMKDLDVIDNEGATPLQIAVQYDHLAVVELLLAQGADFNKARVDDGATPLCMAAYNGHLEMVQVLLVSGADFNETSRKNGTTSLYIAAQNGHLEVVQVLLAMGADFNKATIDDGATPLHVAAQNGHPEVVEVLLAAGADIDKVMADGSTPLQIAAGGGHFEVVEDLLANGADLNRAATNGGATPLLIAAYSGNLEMVQALLAKGADINKAMTDGRTPLNIAILNGHLEIVKALKQQILINYLAERKKETSPEYKKSYTAFGHTFNFGHSENQKVKAAEAILKVINGEEQEDSLKKYKKVLKKGELKSICSIVFRH